jgi:hypothetical protein
MTTRFVRVSITQTSLDPELKRSGIVGAGAQAHAEMSRPAASRSPRPAATSNDRRVGGCQLGAPGRDCPSERISSPLYCNKCATVAQGITGSTRSIVLSRAVTGQRGVDSLAEHHC